MLADLCGKELSRDLVALYDQLLKDLGYDKLCQALENIIATRGDRDPFPSPATIRGRLQPTADDDGLAIDAATRIAGAISKFGYCNPADAQEFIGELGWAVVEREGGWAKICERVTTNQIPSLKAQWRDLAKSLMGRARLGLPTQAPSLPGPTSQKIQGLLPGIGKEI